MIENLSQEKDFYGKAIAAAGQDVLGCTDEDYARQRIEKLRGTLDLITDASAMHPPERKMRVARGLRNAVLMGLTFEGAMHTLDRIRTGDVARVAIGTTVESVQSMVHETWPPTSELGFESNDLRLLATLFSQTNDDFETAVRDPANSTLANMWRDYDSETSQTTIELIDFLESIPEEQRSKKDTTTLEWFLRGGPYDNDDRLGRARRTNSVTTAIAFNLLLSKQRGHDSKLTGPEVGDLFLRNINAASALSGGRKEYVTYKLNPLVCPHTAKSPTHTDASGHYSNLGPFAKRTHVRVFGPCVGYPLLTLGPNDPQRQEKLENIAWHRRATNSGVLTPEHPAQHIRSSEVVLSAAASITSVLWPDSQPFAIQTDR